MKLRKRRNENVWVLEYEDEGWSVALHVSYRRGVDVEVHCGGQSAWLGDVGWEDEWVDEKEVGLIHKPVVMRTFGNRTFEVSEQDQLVANRRIWPEMKWAVATETQRKLIKLRDMFSVVSRLKAEVGYLERNVAHHQRTTRYREAVEKLAERLAEFEAEAGFDSGGFQMMCLLAEIEAEGNEEWDYCLGEFGKTYQAALAVMAANSQTESPARAAEEATTRA